MQAILNTVVKKTSVLRLECADCVGTGFNKDLAKHKIKGQSIFDIWRMTVDEAAEFFKDINPKIITALQDASSILLGHLLIGQPTSTLSCGENIRIKLLKLRNSRSDVLGIDEPFKGLSLTEIHSVVSFLMGMIAKGKTIIVIDHKALRKNFCKFKNCDKSFLICPLSRTEKCTASMNTIGYTSSNGRFCQSSICGRRRSVISDTIPSLTSKP